MARGESLLRQWKLLKILQSRRVGISLRDLAGLAGYTERTIQRDLRLLREAGFPVTHNDDEFGKRFWRLPSQFLEREGIVLSVTEAVSLYFARELLAPLSGTSLAEGLDSVIGKIRALLPQTALEHFAELGERILVRMPGQTDYRRHKQTVSILSEAVQTDQVVEITYRSVWRGERYTAAVHPYGLVYFEGDLYLVGYSERSRAVRVFKVPRILEARRTATRFRRPAGFSLESQFHGSFGIMQPRGGEIEAVVEFDPSVAAIIEERQWHPSQKLTAGPDGKLVASYRLGNTVEFERWIMSFGPRARILRPQSLRNTIRNNLLAAAEAYQSHNTP
ncbi:MAG: helix-turn-helix transcriptional regulator [Phycisphaerae bacterium]